MNLVSKEGPILNTCDGVVVLSKTAGSFEELSPHVLGIDPNDIAETALALKIALRMSARERAKRAKAIRTAIESHQLHDWLAAQLCDLEITSFIQRLETGSSEPAVQCVAVAKAG
jgi:trehalose 6-phosphate synthase